MYIPTKYKEEFIGWIVNQQPKYYITLYLPSCQGNTTRKLFGQWLARIDRRYLGRNWYRFPLNKRTLAVAFVEGQNANLHIHVVLRLPYFQLEEVIFLQKIWHDLTNRNCHIVALAKDDIATVVNYSLKEFHKNGYNFILSNEFHPT